MGNDHIYRIILKASSGFRFVPDGGLHVEDFPGPYGPLKIFFRTRYVDEGFKAQIPRELLVDVIGKVNSLKLAMKAFLDIAQIFSNILSFCANAAASDLEIHVAYDITPGLKKRDFFQNFLISETGMPGFGRIVNLNSILAMLKALQSNPEYKRLFRAIAQYREAILNWLPGREIVALAHLYMGIEALTPIVFKKYCLDNSIKDKNNLLDIWGIKLTKSECNKCNNRERQNKIDSEIRRKIIFRGDEDCYRKAKKASDGLEHGFLPFNEIYELSINTLDRTCKYLRSTILYLSGIDEYNHKILLDPPFDRPLLSWLKRSIKGQLIGDTDIVAAEGYDYPMMVCESNMESFFIDESGNRFAKITDNINKLFSKEVSFEEESLDMYGPPEHAIERVIR